VALLATEVGEPAAGGATVALVGAAMVTGRSARVAGTELPAALDDGEEPAGGARSTLTAGVVEIELLPPATVPSEPFAALMGVAPTVGSAGTTAPPGLIAVPVIDELTLDVGTTVTPDIAVAAGLDDCASAELPAAGPAVPRYFVSSV